MWNKFYDIFILKLHTRTYVYNSRKICVSVAFSLVISRWCGVHAICYQKVLPFFQNFNFFEALDLPTISDQCRDFNYISNLKLIFNVLSHTRKNRTVIKIIFSHVLPTFPQLYYRVLLVLVVLDCSSWRFFDFFLKKIEVSYRHPFNAMR